MRQPPLHIRCPLPLLLYFHFPTSNINFLLPNNNPPKRQSRSNYILITTLTILLLRPLFLPFRSSSLLANLLLHESFTTRPGLQNSFTRLRRPGDTRRAKCLTRDT